MKKLNYEKPMMFYQDGDETSSVYHSPGAGPRIRIVYPSGVVEWATLTEFNPNFDDNDIRLHFNQIPCYLQNRWRPKFKNAKEAIKYIKEFDVLNSYPPMEFLGYL